MLTVISKIRMTIKEYKIPELIVARLYGWGKRNFSVNSVESWYGK